VPLVIIISLAGIAPYLSAILSSFFGGEGGLNVFTGFSNYQRLFNDRGLSLSALISLGWALLSASATILCAFPLAMLARSSKRAWALIFPSLVIVWATPVYIGAPLWRFLLHGVAGDSLFRTLTGLEVNLMNDPLASFIATALVSAWFRLPQATFILLAAAGRSRRALDEAASLDGAGPAALAFSVQLPAMGTALLAVSALELVSAFREFTVPFLLTAGGPPMRAGITDSSIVGATTTLEIYLFDMFSSYADRGVMAAYSVLLSTIIWLLVGGGIALKKTAAGNASWQWHTRRRNARRAGERRVDYIPGRIADRIFLTVSWVIAALVAATVLALLWCIVWMAFSGLSVAFVDSFLPRYPSVAAFREAFLQDGVLLNFANTLYVSLLASAFAIALVFPAAAWLAERPIAKTALAFALLQALASSGGVHSLIPLYELWRRMGLLGGYLPVILVYIYHAAPTALLALSAFLRDQPKSLKEAACLEGMGRFTWLVKVQLPLALPALGASAMLAFLAAWNGFLAPLIFLDDDTKYTIAVRLHSYVGSIASGAPKWNRFAAVSLVNVAIVAVLFWRFKKPLSRSALADHGED
jgi:ABC-type glycerol-3-phosphate transport system permease component